MYKKLLLVAFCTLSALTMDSPIESKTRRTRTQQQTQNVGLETQAQVEEIQKLTEQARKGENLDQAFDTAHTLARESDNSEVISSVASVCISLSESGN